MSDKDEKKDTGKTLADTPMSKKGEPTDPKRPTAAKTSRFMIPENHAWAGLWKIFAGVGVVGLILAGIGYTQDPERFAFSYSVAFAWGLTLALGGMFFVLIQHLTNAGWSVVVRRVAEQLMATLPLFLLLFVPIVLFKNTLYPWLGEAAHEPAIVAKQGYLNFPFWIVRAFFYFGVWIFFAARLYNLSREQDTTGNALLTNKMRALSAPGILLFSVSITFAGFDWIMSMEPAWYSTMWGVYIFGGAVVSSLALLIVVFTQMGKSKLLAKEVTAEHYHDIGKLMFAFTIFWAYIAFDQYMLIWYANIPEETIFYLHRQDNGWGTVGIILVLAGFFFPFFLMLSRHSKRWAGPRVVGGVWILIMHYVDFYWIVMPNHDHHLHVNALQDVGCWLLVGGAMLAWMFKGMAGAPLVPVRDPRLPRSLAFENALGTDGHGARARRSEEPPHRRYRPRQHGRADRDDVRPRQLLRHPPRRAAAGEGPRA